MPLILQMQVFSNTPFAVIKKIRIMKTQNEVQLIGYLGRDPMMSIAVNGSKQAHN